MTLNRSESEPSVKEQIFNTLLRTPHRSVDEVLAIHRDQLGRDPFLYGQLAVYAVLEGQCAVRDIQDVFVAVLFTSDHLEHRHAAWVMLQGFPPHRVARVLSYITGYDERLTHREGIGGTVDPPIPAEAFGSHSVCAQGGINSVNGWPALGIRYKLAHYSKHHHDAEKRGKQKPVETKPISRSLRSHLKTSARSMVVSHYVVHHDCLNKWANGIVKSAVTNYLRYREREDNRALLEGALIRFHSDLKTLYKKMHVKPSDLVQAALFENKPPEGSRVEALKRLIASDDPTEQAQIITKNNLPYSVVRSLIAKTPSTTVASIMVMTPQEIMANLKTLKRDGAFDNPDIKELILSKLSAAKTAKKGRMDALKGETVLEAVAGLDDDTKQIISDVTDAQLKQYGTISVPTVLLIDKSYSMTDAIEMGKKLGAAIGQASGENFRGCWIFNTEHCRIKFTKSEDAGSYSVWTRKLRMHHADGGTDLGGCIPAMIRANVDAEQIVIITDEDENGHPLFYEQMPKFREKFGHLPDVVIVRVGSALDRVEKTLKGVGVKVDVLNASNIDKISIPNLLQLLSKKSVSELIQDVMELPMPTPEDWKRDHAPQRKALA